MYQRLSRLTILCFLTVSTLPSALGQQPVVSPDARETRRQDEARQREKSLRDICDRLGVGKGRTIADIGAGNGRDSWTFADIVGENGTMYAEEIDEGRKNAIQKEAGDRKLPQVQAVLGKVDDPALPPGNVDMAFMHYVYHHLSRPREMLQGIWKALKPGGYLVIVDRHLGTLVDWVPREDRAGKHYWIAETTVVREAREQGFTFVECAEGCWNAKDTFVLVFQRPAGLDAPDRDPDPPSTLPADAVKLLLPPPGKTYRRVAFVALGDARKLIAPIRDETSCAGVDIVLEEWATRKDERPPAPPGVALPSVLTERGDPRLGPESIDAVYFLDTYHLLFHTPALLGHLRERLTDSGCVYVLDRKSPSRIAHREASHRRMIAPETVEEEMGQAGFTLLRREPPPTTDRFLLVFGKAVPANPHASSDAEE